MSRCYLCNTDLESLSFSETTASIAVCDHCKNNDALVRLSRNGKEIHTLWVAQPDGDFPETWAHEGDIYPLLVTDAIGAFYDLTESSEESRAR